MPLYLVFIDPAGASMFVLSVVLLLGTSLRLARRLATTPGERFWLAVAATYLQIGMIATLLSIGHWMTRESFLAAQLLVAVIAWRVLNRKERRAARLVGVCAIDAAPLRVWLLALIVIVLACHLIVQVKTPLHHFDDRMYRAPRAAYWMQHRSLLP